MYFNYPPFTHKTICILFCQTFYFISILSCAMLCKFLCVVICIISSSFFQSFFSMLCAKQSADNVGLSTGFGLCLDLLMRGVALCFVMHSSDFLVVVWGSGNWNRIQKQVKWKKIYFKLFYFCFKSDQGYCVGLEKSISLVSFMAMLIFKALEKWQ